MSLEYVTCVLLRLVYFLTRHDPLVALLRLVFNLLIGREGEKRAFLFYR